jgi:type VI protein secretion system component VasA
MATSDWSDFLVVDWLTMEHICQEKEPIRKQDTTRNNQSTAETHTSFDMSRKSKSKDHTKALNIPLTLTQGDLLQEALVVTFAKDQTQALRDLRLSPN